jgi:hypothetical protein
MVEMSFAASCAVGVRVASASLRSYHYLSFSAVHYLCVDQERSPFVEAKWRSNLSWKRRWFVSAACNDVKNENVD